MLPLWFLDLLMRSMFGVACCTYVTACFDQMDFARVAVHGDPLPVGQYLRYAGDIDGGGDAVFAGDDCAVGELSTGSHDDGRGAQEQRRPRRIRRGGDQDFAVAQADAFRGVVQQPDGAGRAPGGMMKP